MKGFVRFVLGMLVISSVIVSCSKDEDTGRLTFDSPALYLEEQGSGTVSFTAYQVKLTSLTVTNKPTGWSDPVLDVATGKLTITAPEKLGDEIAQSGNIILSGISNGGTALSATLFVGIVSTEDLSAAPSNSYVVSKNNTRYLLDATSTGEITGKITPASVKIVWQTATSLLQYLQLEGDKFSFYVGGDTDTIIAGNALIGAYDADGKLLWSWHMWIVDYNPEAEAQTYLNGFTVMDRNLGALENKNSTEDEILSSYGLYYQWGRKDPFVGPNKYNAANGASAAMYNNNKGRVYITVKESDATTGTLEYAHQNPVCFISGVKASEYDWRWSSHTESLWADVKTINDPCPRGWKVAPAGAFEGLHIVDDLSAGYSEYENKYGWTLTDNSVSSLYIAAGRRIYTNSTIQNIYQPAMRNVAMEAQPWVGLYWTNGMNGTNSSAFYFWFDKKNVAASGVENSASHYRANGMQVRCVKATL